MAQTEIVGAQALQRDLLNLGKNGGAIATEIQASAIRAGDPVVTRARALWPRGNSSPHHADSVRVVQTPQGADVVEGGPDFPGTGWIDFGGTRGRIYLAGGRYLFPAAAGLDRVVADSFSESIQAVLNRSGSWSNTSSEGAAITQ